MPPVVYLISLPPQRRSHWLSGALRSSRAMFVIGEIGGIEVVRSGPIRVGQQPAIVGADDLTDAWCHPAPRT